MTDPVMGEFYFHIWVKEEKKQSDTSDVDSSIPFTLTWFL